MLQSTSPTLIMSANSLVTITLLLLLHAASAKDQTGLSNALARLPTQLRGYSKRDISSHSNRRLQQQPSTIYDITVFGSFAGTVPGVQASVSDSHGLYVKQGGFIGFWGSDVAGETTIPAFVNGAAVKVAAGRNCSAALLQDGSVAVWGLLKQADVPTEALSNVVDIAVGFGHVVALKSDGSVVTWGDNSAGQLQIPFGVSGIQAIAAQATTTMLLTSGGSVIVTGDNTYGQISQMPPNLLGVVGVSAIAAGQHHCLALLNGQVISWGFWGQNQVPAAAASGIVAIAAGVNHSLALTSTGQLLAWGADDKNQIQVPAQLQNGGAANISASFSNSVVYANPSQVSSPAPLPSQLPPPPPVVVSSPPPVITSNPSPPPAPVITSPPAPNTNNPPSPPSTVPDNGALVYWGASNAFPPKPLTNVVSMKAGELHGLALFNNGTVYAWADSQYDALYGLSTPPAAVTAGTVVIVAAHGNVSAVVMEDGQVIAWGDDSRGLVTSLSGRLDNVKDLQLGQTHALVLLTDKTLQGFGSNFDGQTTIPQEVQGSVEAIAVGGVHNLLLLSNGNVTAFGNNLFNQSSVPANAQTDAAGIAAGYIHSVVLKKDGTVVAFGADNVNQLKVPIGLTNVVELAAGRAFTLALQASGNVVAWGFNADGQTDVATEATSGITGISAGDFTGFAIKGRAQGKIVVPSPPSIPTPINSPVPVSGSSPPAPGNGIPVATQSQESSKGVPIGAIAGGIAGGVILVAVLVIALLWRVRRPAVVGSDTGRPQGPFPGSHGSETHSVDGAAAIAIPPPPSVFPNQGPAGGYKQDAPYPMGGQPPQGQYPPYGNMYPASPAASQELHSNGFKYQAGGAYPYDYTGNSAGAYSAGNNPSGVMQSYASAADHHSGGLPTGGSASMPQTQTGMHPHTGSYVSGTGGRNTAVTNVSSRSGASGSRQLSVSAGEITQAAQMYLMESLRISCADISVGEVIGVGGFGQVVKGTWRGNRVAVKMLNLEGTIPEAKAILHQEALIMAQIQHPSIVRVFGLVDEDHYQALVMQYYKRGTLAAAMRTLWYVNVSEATRLMWAFQIASGMCFLHERKPTPIIHGDLKASNLLLDDNGQKVYIADFGLACKLHSPSTAMQMGALTASISPPEVLMAPTAPRTAAADVFAFGVVLYEIMTGRPAFRGMTVEQIRDTICSGRFQPQLDGIGQRVASLIVECTTYHPEERPHFGAIIERLNEILAEVQGSWQGNVDTTAIMEDTTWR